MPKRKLMTKYDWWILFILAIFGASLLIHWFVEPEVATAQTVELRDCRSNEECLALYCEGNTGYVQEVDLTKLCHD